MDQTLRIHELEKEVRELKAERDRFIDIACMYAKSVGKCEPNPHVSSPKDG